VSIALKNKLISSWLHSLFITCRTFNWTHPDLSLLDFYQNLPSTPLFLHRGFSFLHNSLSKRGA